MSTRKRTHQSLPDDSLVDELSPSKPNSGKKDLLGSVKKRKLNTYGSATEQRKGGFIENLGKLFSWNGKGKEDVSVRGGDEEGEEGEDELSKDMDEDEDAELAEEVEQERGVKTGDIWDTPVSTDEEGEDDEEEEGPVRSARNNTGKHKSEDNAKAKRETKKIKEKKAAALRELESEEELEVDIYDLQSSDAEKSVPAGIRASAKRGAPFATKSTLTPVAKLHAAKKAAEEGRDTPTKQSAGRPRKRVENGNGTSRKFTPGRQKKMDEQNSTTSKRTPGRPRALEKEIEPSPKRSSGRPRKSDILKKAKALSRQAIREEMTRRVEDSAEEDFTESTVVKPKRKSGRKSMPELEDKSVVDALDVPASRGRGRPRKHIEAVAESQVAVPKGILTPSKGRPIKSRKSVNFEAQEVDLGFKDLPTSTKKKQKGRKVSEEATDTEELEDLPATPNKSPKKLKEVPEPREEPDSEEDEDVACAICLGLESATPNLIILCENCDLAVHQACYGVPIIPEGEWLCKDCRPEVDDLMDLDLDDDLTTTQLSSKLPEIEGFETHLRNIQRLVLDKLTGQKRIKLCGHNEEMQKVHQVVEQTVLAGEGNSMLVIGARGCGKTNLVESVISELSTEHRDSFHVVRLNGFIHTDDKLALKEIWRQLGREMEVEDDGKSNYADTLASLLALLSHPSEISENQDDQTAKSVVFVLDEFDLFTTHSRQTLLYNLFDIAQARKAPIVVLGLTTRVDVVEALEKRVKSRFSHRYVHLSLPRSVPAFWEICKEGLTAKSEELDEACFDTEVNGFDDFLSFWQSMINDLYSKDALFKHHLQSHFYRSKSVPSFLVSCILPIANLSPKNFPLTGRPFTSNAMSLTPPDSKLHILQGLSELELALLIAAARLDIILDTDTCNFAMAYDEYSSLTSRHKIQTSSTGMAALGASAKVWGRDIALGAWERLAEYDLLVPTGIGGGAARDFGAGGRMWKVDVGLEEITGSVDGLSGVMAKWCREI